MMDWREYALESVDMGIISKDALILACIQYMSQDEVRDMLVINEFIPEEEEAA